MLFLKKRISVSSFFVGGTNRLAALCLLVGGGGAEMVCVYTGRVLSGVLSAISSHALCIKLSPSST